MTALASSPKGTTEVDRYIGGRVRSRRLHCGLSQQKLADALGVTFPQVQKYENGTNRISVSRLQQMSKVLGVSVASFFDGLPNEEPADGAASETKLDGPDSRELMRLWGAIADPAVRRNVLDLLGALAHRAR